MMAKTSWQRRENSLLIGTPLVLLPALALLPTTVFLIVSPVFAHARMIGLFLLPVYGISEVIGMGRMAHCLRQLDVITLLAVGTLVILLVVIITTGILLVGFVYPQ